MLLIFMHYVITLVVLFASGHQDLQTILYLSATAITTTGYEAMASVELTRNIQLFQVYQVCAGLFFIMAVAQGLINVVMYHIVTKKLKSKVSVQRSFFKRHKLQILLVCFSIFWVFSGVVIFHWSGQLEICRLGDCRKPNFTDAIWFAILSVSTVGLGDISPKTQSIIFGIFMSIWLLVGALVFTPGIVVLSRPLGTWLFPESDLEFRELLESSMINKEDAEALVQEAKAHNIEKHTFLTATLVKRNLVDQKLIDNILKQFDDLDTNKDGTLDYGELLSWLETDEEKRKKLVEKNNIRKEKVGMFSLAKLKNFYSEQRKRKFMRANRTITATNVFISGIRKK